MIYYDLDAVTSALVVKLSPKNPNAVYWDIYERLGDAVDMGEQEYELQYETTVIPITITYVTPDVIEDEAQLYQLVQFTF
jgi:hypothetical protein